MDDSFEGKIVEGFGKGAKFVAMPGYLEQFKSKLKIEPFLGTLNIQVDIDKSNLYLFDSITIDGFKEENKNFGSIKCIKCLINNTIEAWIIIIEKSTHNNNILEIISEKRIRDYYSTEINVKLQ